MTNEASVMVVLKKSKEKNNDAMVMILTGCESLNAAIDALWLGTVDYRRKLMKKKRDFQGVPLV